MSTRAVITFVDEEENTFSVYQHYDGDPDTVAQNLTAACALAWPLPRFEADDFAAAYIAATKKGGGNIRVMETGKHRMRDLSYEYLVSVKRLGTSNKVAMWMEFKDSDGDYDSLMVQCVEADAA